MHRCDMEIFRNCKVPHILFRSSIGVRIERTPPSIQRWNVEAARLADIVDALLIVAARV